MTATRSTHVHAAHVATAETATHVATAETDAHVTAAEASTHVAATHMAAATHVTASTSAARERAGGRQCEGCCENCYEGDFLAHDVHPSARGCRPASQLSARAPNGIGCHMLLTADMRAARATHAHGFR
jgi:hypothetical protein